MYFKEYPIFNCDLKLINNDKTFKNLTAIKSEISATTLFKFFKDDVNTKYSLIVIFIGSLIIYRNHNLTLKQKKALNYINKYKNDESIKPKYKSKLDAFLSLTENKMQVSPLLLTNNKMQDETKHKYLKYKKKYLLLKNNIKKM